MYDISFCRQEQKKLPFQLSSRERPVVFFVLSQTFHHLIMSFRILFQSMWCIILMGSIGLILLWIVISNHHYFSSPYGANTLVNTWIRNMEFEGFNNETGVDHFIVPNIVHFIRFNQTEFTFVDYLCLQSAYRRQHPDYVFIHADNISFHGKYWSLIERDLELKAKIKIIHLELPSEIFGQPLNPEWRRWHGSDVARIRTMMKYGGIYLDNDVFVIQNLDKYRRFEISLEWQVDNQLNTSIIGNQIVIAHKDARFLAHWLDSYRSYRLNSW